MAFVYLSLLGLLWLLCIWILHQRRPPQAPALYRDVLAGGLLFLGVIGFFWRTLSGDVYQPADGGDLVSFLYPTYRFAAEQLAQGALPLWNPHLYGGAPFISDIQAGFLYLPLLALFVAWPDFSYEVLQWLSALHIYWAGLGMYVLLRTLTWPGRLLKDEALQDGDMQDGIWPGRVLARPAALFGAVAFQYSDPLLVHFGNLNLIAVLSWLPWVLAAFSRALYTGQSMRAQLPWAVAAGVLFAAGNYAGHAQSSVYIGMTLGLYTLFWIIGGTASAEMADVEQSEPDMAAREANTVWARVRAGAAALLLTGLVTGLLTAPILLPALELSGYTERSRFTYQETVAFSLAPAQAIGLVTPGFFGRGPALHWSLWDRVETPYAGVPTLLFAVGGLLLAGAADRRRLWIWVGIALFGFVTALGVYAILHGWLTWGVPGFGQLRAPARALVLWTLGISVVAAYGLDTFVQRERRPFVDPLSKVLSAGAGYMVFLRGGAVVWAAIILPVSYLALLLTQESEAAFLRASVATLALVLAALFWIVTWALAAAYRAGWFSPAVFVLSAVLLLYVDLSATGAYTDISSSDPTVGYYHPQVVQFLRADPELFRIDTRTGIEHLWQPDTAALYGLQDVGGIANPLTLQHWIQLWESTGGRHTAQYDLLNVKYVLVEGDTPLPDGKFNRVLEESGITVHENLAFHPRAWVVHTAEVVENQVVALARFAAGDLNLSATVILEEADAARIPPHVAKGGEGSAVVTHYGSSTLAATASSSDAGYLVLSEVWYPGWHATVNGEAVPILRANSAQRAIPIPAGDSTIRLWFWPRTWTWGLALAAIGVVTSLGLLRYGARTDHNL